MIPEMSNKLLIFLTAVLLFACSAAAAGGEENKIQIAAGEDWSWESGTVDMIEGMIDLSEYVGREISVRILSDLPYASEEEQKGQPVFVTVNGKRITVKKQSDTTRCTPSDEESRMYFSARLTLPEKKRVYRISFQFVLTDENGQELKTLSAELNGGQGGTGSVFYIAADINKITFIIGIAAAAVWAAALIRMLNNRKKEKSGD